MAPGAGSAAYDLGEVVREGLAGPLRAGVYRPSGLRVTVEEIREEFRSRPGFLERLAATGRLATSLRHPNLVPVYDLLREDDALRQVDGWTEGGTLQSQPRLGGFTAAEVVALVDGVLAGLEALHAAGLRHGHLSSSTVVVEGGIPRLAEVAVAAALGGEELRAEEDVAAAARLGLELLPAAAPAELRSLLTAAAATPGSAADLRASLPTALAGPAAPPAPPPQPRRRARRALLLALLGALAVAVGVGVALLVLSLTRGGGGTAEPLTLGRDLTLTVSPSHGGCDTTFIFTARGSLRGVGDLVYRWEQSDGQATADTSLPVTADDGSFRLTQAWRLEGSQTVKGSMSLHLLKPADRVLRAGFTYQCP